MVMQKRPLLLLYNAFWVDMPDDHPGCEITRDAARIADADIVAFHLPNVDRGAMPAKRAGQVWVGWTMESDACYPHQADPAFLRPFDRLVSYRRDADVWLPYFNAGTPDALRRPPGPKTCGIAYVQSGKTELWGRRDYVWVMMRHAVIDSYGRSLRNRPAWPDWAPDDKLRLMERYAFTLAFENSIAEDYVTEKFFDALSVGSVPVYRGAPNIEDFAPGEDCYVDARRFDGPAALARHLDHLLRTPEAYRRHLAWKERPLRPAFVALAERVRVDPISRLLEGLAEGPH